MKNHFIFSYSGNKRGEVEKIYNNIKDIDNYNNIVEPFMGTSALSCYIASKHPKKFNYYLNDNNKFLVDIYNILQSEEKTNKLNEEINKITKDMTKEIYIKLDQSLLTTYIIYNKYKVLRAGLWNLKYKYKPIDLNEYPITKFLRNENIIISNIDGIDIVNKFRDDEKSFIFLDPPYINTCNSFYDNPNVNIYEYLYNNTIQNFKSLIICVLENNWIIKLLFEGKAIIIEYDKIYNASKRKTTHLMISNK